MNNPFEVQIASDEETARLNENRRQASQRYWSLVAKGQVYHGMVSPAVIAKRRAKNRLARKQRRINRLRSR